MAERSVVLLALEAQPLFAETMYGDAPHSGSVVLAAANLLAGAACCPTGTQVQPAHGLGRVSASNPWTARPMMSRLPRNPHALLHTL